MKLGRLEIQWRRLYPKYPVDIANGKDLSAALAVPDTNDIWRAVHQSINEVEQETIEGARRFTANPHQCIAAVGAGEGAALVRTRLIEKRENAIAEAKKIRREIA